MKKRREGKEGKGRIEKSKKKGKKVRKIIIDRREGSKRRKYAR